MFFKNKTDLILHHFGVHQRLQCFCSLLSDQECVIHFCSKSHQKYSKGITLAGDSSNQVTVPVAMRCTQHFKGSLQLWSMDPFEKPDRSDTQNPCPRKMHIQVLQKMSRRLTPEACPRSTIKLPHYTNLEPSLYIPTQNSQANEGK